jgi:hypothetical protein
MIVQYLMLASVVVIVILVSLTLAGTDKLKKEVVGTIQTENATVDVTTTTADVRFFEGSFIQPANSRITSILVIPLAAIVGTGTIGFKAGTTVSINGTTGGAADIVASAASGLAASAAAAVLLSANSATIVTAAGYTNVDRRVYVDVTNSAALTTGGVVRFVVSYQKF